MRIVDSCGDWVEVEGWTHASKQPELLGYVWLNLGRKGEDDHFAQLELEPPAARQLFELLGTLMVAPTAVPEPVEPASPDRGTGG